MFLPVPLEEKRLLTRMLKPLLDEAADVDHFTLDKADFNRKASDGFFSLKIQSAAGTFGVLYNDFRCAGGSYGQRNSQRLRSFIDELAVKRIPLLFAVDSMGARITEGRRVFQHAFAIFPSLLRYIRNNLLVTCNIGRALGVGAIMFAAGHYRMAIKGKSLTNITGPEVLRLFFGEAHDFNSIASSDTHLQNNVLINDLSESKEEMFGKARQLLSVRQRRVVEPLLPQPSVSFPTALSSVDPEINLTSILDAISTARTEVFACLATSVKTFIATRNGRSFGVFINPPGYPNNLITALALDKYMLALNLFRALRLPVVSFIDTPGADPRDNQKGNNDVIAKMLAIIREIIDYPYGKMGIVAGRGYGGATVLGFPKVLGSQKVFALEGASIGIMDSRIVESLFSNSKALMSAWQQVSPTQTADLSDLIGDGAIDGILKPASVVPALDQFLVSCLEGQADNAAANSGDCDGTGKRDSIYPGPREDH
jgi:methylmalonyl-CoA decarboxylase subunit alpha